MYFPEDQKPEVKPGVQRATILSASEKWYEPMGSEIVEIVLRCENGAEITNRIKTEYTKALAAIVRAGGLEPRGEVNVADMAGAAVLVTVEMNERGYPRCTHWQRAEADQPKGKRKLLPSEVALTKTDNAANGGDDFPF